MHKLFLLTYKYIDLSIKVSIYIALLGHGALEESAILA
jgi:hypothetical protein